MEANQLPTPPGQFNVTIPNYWPKESAGAGSCKLLGIKRVT
jgi:hypothetical protein